jgi:acyl-CoA synthetase (NDP forming)
VTNAGGAGVMAADAAEWEGLTVARLSETTVRALAARLPPAAALYNPVDILGDANAQRYREALELVLGDPGVDMVTALSAPVAILRFSELAEVVAEAKERFGKPIAVSFMAGELGEEAEEILRKAGIPSFFDPARAVRALAALAKYAEIRARTPYTSAQLPRGSAQGPKDPEKRRRKRPGPLGLGSYGAPFRLRYTRSQGRRR